MIYDKLVNLYDSIGGSSEGVKTFISLYYDGDDEEDEEEKEEEGFDKEEEIGNEPNEPEEIPEEEKSDYFGNEDFE